MGSILDPSPLKPLLNRPEVPDGDNFAEEEAMSLIYSLELTIMLFEQLFIYAFLQACYCRDM